jgi:hypothetical protein
MNTTLNLRSFTLLLLVSVGFGTTLLFASGGNCEGTAKACIEIQSGDCTTQEGCYASYEMTHCAGTPVACILIGSKSVCDRQGGCRWSR